MDQATFHIYLTIFNLVGLGLLGVAGWFMKTAVDSFKDKINEIHAAQKEQAKDIVDVKVHYLLKDDFSEFKDELWRKLDDLKEIVKHKE